MPNAQPALRRFRVHAREAGRHPGRLLEEATIEAAAIAYLEDHALDGAGEVRIIVHDVETGHDHCFVIDTETGEAAPCN